MIELDAASRRWTWPLGRPGRALGRRRADALLVTKLVNVRWLTGFTGSAGMASCAGRPGAARHRRPLPTQAAEQVAAAGLDRPTVEIAIGTTVAAQTELLAAATDDLARLALEAHAVTWADQRRYADELRPELVASSALVDGSGVVKDDGEIARIEAAAAIATEALTTVRAPAGTAPPRPSSASSSTPRCAASGPAARASRRSWRPGPTPPSRTTARRRPIAEGDLVVLDFGAKVDGYCSDMTRTVAIGEPTGRAAAPARHRHRGPGGRGGGRAAGAACRGRRRRLPRPDHRRRLGRRLQPRHRPRRRPGDPRGPPTVVAAPEGATLSRPLRRDRGAGRLPGRDRRRPHRGQPRRHRRRLPFLTHAPKDPQWPSPPTT